MPSRFYPRNIDFFEMDCLARPISSKIHHLLKYTKKKIRFFLKTFNFNWFLKDHLKGILGIFKAVLAKGLI